MAPRDPHPFPAVPGARGSLSMRREQALYEQMEPRGEPGAPGDDRIDLAEDDK